MTNPSIKHPALRDMLAHELDVVRRCKNQVRGGGVSSSASIQRIVTNLDMQSRGMRQMTQTINAAMTLGQLSIIVRYPTTPAKRVRLPRGNA